MSISDHWIWEKMAELEKQIKRLESAEPSTPRRFVSLTVPGLKAPMPIGVVIVDGQPYAVINNAAQGNLAGTFQVTVHLEPFQEVEEGASQ